MFKRPKDAIQNFNWFILNRIWEGGWQWTPPFFFFLPSGFNKRRFFLKHGVYRTVKRLVRVKNELKIDQNFFVIKGTDIKTTFLKINVKHVSHTCQKTKNILYISHNFFLDFFQTSLAPELFVIFKIFFRKGEVHCNPLPSSLSFFSGG